MRPLRARQTRVSQLLVVMAWRLDVFGHGTLHVPPRLAPPPTLPFAHACRTPPPPSYTCGLWSLFHSLSVKVTPEDRGGTAWVVAVRDASRSEGLGRGGMRAQYHSPPAAASLDSLSCPHHLLPPTLQVRGFVKHFFQCTECAKHFAAMVDAEPAKNVVSRRDAAIWAWGAHNRVNGRVAGAEAEAGDGDPKHPKQPWPSSAACPACRAPAPGPDGSPQWNGDAVYAYLVKYYAPAGAVARSGTAAVRRELRAPPGSRLAVGPHPLAALALFGVVAVAVAVLARQSQVPRRGKAAVL